MIWALIGIVVIAEAAKLDNSYLPPPPSAKESGGSDGALQLPLEPPYIDQYTPAEDKPEVWRPGTRSLKKGSKGSTPDDNKFLENEDEITVPALEKGRFISGSYSYTGPDNVLVTVTYKADSRKGRKEDEDAKVTDDNVAEDNGEDEAEEEEEDVVSDDQEDDEELIVPTPSSLPAELARAFDFHKNKNFAEEEKTTRTKKPIRKIHKNKVNKHGGNYYGNPNPNYEGQYGQKIPGHIHGHKQGSQGFAGPAYQYPVPNYEGPSGQKIPGHHAHKQGNQGIAGPAYQYPVPSHEVTSGQKNPGHHGHKQGSQGFAEPSYQYPPPNQYGPASISQGYSYPKAS